MAANEQELLKERKEHCLTLTINRPERRNAITGSVIKRLSEELKQADQDPEIRVEAPDASDQPIERIRSLERLDDGRQVPHPAPRPHRRPRRSRPGTSSRRGRRSVR